MQYNVYGIQGIEELLEECIKNAFQTYINSITICAIMDQIYHTSINCQRRVFMVRPTCNPVDHMSIILPKIESLLS